MAPERQAANAGRTMTEQERLIFWQDILFREERGLPLTPQQERLRQATITRPRDDNDE